MFRALAAGVTGALTLAAGSPAAAAVSPISVSSCDYVTYDMPSIPATPLLRHANLRITFTNEAPLTATDVRFAVRYRASTEVVEENGKFSSGTPITHDFQPSASPWYHGSAECSVQSVTFSDGSTWQPG
jgi:hypothetical protein